MQNIDVVILSGGKGERLKEVLNDRPKPMADIGGRPFLDIILDYVSGYGFKRFILCTGYMSDVIKNYYFDKSGGREIYFSNEDKPLGTSGAVKNAEKLIQTSPFLVMNGDSFCPVDLIKFYDFHMRNKALVSIVVVMSGNNGDYGSIVIDETKRIISFKEKAPNQEKTFINAGIYFFQKEVLTRIPSGEKYSLEYDLFPKLIGHEFYGYIATEKIIDIGTPERYEQAKRFFAT